MNVAEIIAKEFSSSMSMAIRNLGKSIGEEKVQVVLELDSSGGNIYKLCRDFQFVRLLDLKEILYISPIYSMFKSKIPGSIKDFLISLAEEQGVPHNCISVFAVRSKAGINSIRLMLYVKSQYCNEITADHLIKINSKQNA